MAPPPTDALKPAIPVIELRGASKGYGTGASRSEVLTDLNLNVAEGEFLAIVGFSGSGKTTLINLLAGLLQADAGVVRLDGQPMPPAGPDRALVFQNYSLLPWLTVHGNIALAVDQVFAEWTVARRAEHIANSIAKVGLTPARDKRPAQLSGGMRQRVAVARALAMEPRVLLLDEPLGALDALTRANLQDEISRIWQEDKKTVVLITNDPDEAILLADRVIPLSAGPGATFGPSFAIDLPRPRDRLALNHDPRFKRLRKDLLEWLTVSARHSSGPAASRPARLPALVPANLDQVTWIDRAFPRRGKNGEATIKVP